MQHLFLREIEFQARIAARAAARLPDGRSDFDRDDAWGVIQLILGAAANVSKILWPSPKSPYADRGTMLRALLALDEHHTLFGRELRNHFEHYDDRIDQWLAKVGSATYTDQVIGQLSGFLAQFPESANRHYDPITRRLSFRGDFVDLGLVLDALADLHARCRQAVVLREGATLANNSPSEPPLIPPSPTTESIHADPRSGAS